MRLALSLAATQPWAHASKPMFSMSAASGMVSSLAAQHYVSASLPTTAGMASSSILGASIAPSIATTAAATSAWNPGGSAVLSYIGRLQSGAQSPITFTNADIGTAASDRLVVVLVTYGGNTSSLSSVTIGGTTATPNVTQNGSGWNGVGIHSLVVPSGTTANIVVTTGGGIAQDVLNCYVYTITGLVSTTPTGVNSGYSAGLAGPSTYPVTGTSGGVFIGGAMNYNATNDATQMTTGGYLNTTDDASTYTVSVAKWSTLACHSAPSTSFTGGFTENGSNSHWWAGAWAAWY